MTARTGPAATVHLIGRTSYIAGAIAPALGAGWPLRHVGVQEFIERPSARGDIVVNCAFDPGLFDEPYSEALDLDRQIGMAAEAAGSRYVMLSTREVYAPRVVPPLVETEAPAPATRYGENKARIERTLSLLLGDNLLIVRLANVFGGELLGRHTFVSTALTSVRRDGVIRFDMAADTVKDFVPARYVGEAIAALLSCGASGVVNLGSGVAMTVGDVAAALIRGNGGGETIVTGAQKGAEFGLDVGRLSDLTGLTLDRAAVLAALEETAGEQRHG